MVVYTYINSLSPILLDWISEISCLLVATGLSSYFVNFDAASRLGCTCIDLYCDDMYGYR